MTFQNEIRFIHYIGEDVYLIPKKAVDILLMAESDFLLIDEVLNDIENYSAELFIITKNGNILGVFVGNYNITPLKKDYCIIALAGEKMEKWIDDLIEFLTIKCMRENINKFYVMGRRGWGKIYSQFQEKAVIYECPVPKGGGLTSIH